VWRVKNKKTSITFRQQLDDSAYSYVYTKNIGLPKGKPQLVLSHTLKNTGTKIIETDVFDHNFFRVDSQLTAPGLVLKFRFHLLAEKADSRGIDDLAAIRGDSIFILRQFTGKQSVYAVLQGYNNQPTDYDIKLENTTTGTGIRITADRPLSKLVFWGSSTVVCPEPYIHVRVPPGESFTWTIRYEFYEK
jgi:hypothetical protein